MTRRPALTVLGLRVLGLRVLGPLLAVVTLGLAACTDGAEPGQGFVSGPGTVTRVSPADRPPAPALQGTTMAGRAFDLATYRGQVVVLNFWGSWCSPCRAEAPALERVATAMRPRGVVFVGVDTRDPDQDAARAFLRNVGTTYVNLDDSDGRLALRFQEGPVRLPPQSIPATLVVDRRGRIAARILGPTTQPRLTDLLTSIATEPA